MKFIADVMLGRLARFMRFSGYDVEYDSKADDEFLLHRSRYRILLTRDRELANRAAKRKVYFVQTTGAEHQLAEIRSHFSIQGSFPRCIVCNNPIRKVRKATVKHLVPPYVFRIQPEFFCCKKCGRVYWKGTHFDRLTKTLRLSGNARDNQ